ncbi:hypothetical protein [Singulisphaera sp. PoT]|uniref:hypothetical protein n=1 Tax=Singulisphaera sp. PoT TaxID=3411797 RepID=UPI003BF576BF
MKPPSSQIRSCLIALAAFGAILFASGGGTQAVAGCGEAEASQVQSCCGSSSPIASCCCTSSVPSTPDAKSTLTPSNASAAPVAILTGGTHCLCRSSSPPAPTERPKARVQDERNDPGHDPSSIILGVAPTRSIRSNASAYDLGRRLPGANLHLRSTRLLI